MGIFLRPPHPVPKPSSNQKLNQIKEPHHTMAIQKWQGKVETIVTPGKTHARGSNRTKYTHNRTINEDKVYKVMQVESAPEISEYKKYMCWGNTPAWLASLGAYQPSGQYCGYCSRVFDGLIRGLMTTKQYADHSGTNSQTLQLHHKSADSIETTCIQDRGMKTKA